jgi:hypothetical protein
MGPSNMFNSEKKNKLLFIFLFIFCGGLFLISLVSDKFNLGSSRATYQYAEHDNLDFLTQNSDLIAVLELTDASTPGDSRTKVYSTKSAPGKIIKTIKGNVGRNEIVTILNEPYFLKRPSIMAFLALYNGKHLIFLKNVGTNKYKPLTKHSLMRVIFGKCEPVWKQPKDSKYYDVTSIPLSDVLIEIKANLNQN